jgi:hypothetical protein
LERSALVEARALEQIADCSFICSRRTFGEDGSKLHDRAISQKSRFEAAYNPLIHVKGYAAPETKAESASGTRPEVHRRVLALTLPISLSGSQ